MFFHDYITMNSLPNILLKLYLNPKVLTLTLSRLLHKLHTSQTHSTFCCSGIKPIHKSVRYPMVHPLWGRHGRGQHPSWLLGTWGQQGRRAILTGRWMDENLNSSFYLWCHGTRFLCHFLSKCSFNFQYCKTQYSKLMRLNMPITGPIKWYLHTHF